MTDAPTETPQDNLYTPNDATQAVYPYYQHVSVAQQLAKAYLNRPARRQVKKGSQPVRPEFTHHSSDYNIWYHKKLGDRFVKEDRIKAATRCNISTDAGYTRADLEKKDTWLCIYFARGHCSNGAECGYFHRVPTEEDEARIDLAHDIFGRERHRNYREDMGGVGSFTRDNKTLYIGGIKRGANSEELVKKHFSEWGDLDYVRMIWDKSIAFVKYKLRTQAEFAKEAMQDQDLEGDEVLSIRWSNEDPNPVAQKNDEQKVLMQLAQSVAQKQREVDPLYQYKNSDGKEQLDYFPNESNPSHYPETNHQFSDYSNSTKVISEWLKESQMSEYSDAILAAGYFDLQSLTQIDDIGLDAIGITKPEHRKKMLTAVSNLSEKLATEAAVSQTYDYSNYYNQQASYDPNYYAQSYWYTNSEYTGDQPGYETQAVAQEVPVTSQKRAAPAKQSTKQDQKKSKVSPQNKKQPQKSKSLVQYGDSDED